MAIPTTFYRWTLPREDQDPWFESMVSVFNNIDSSVSSMESTCLPKTTLVLSVHPTNSAMIVSSAPLVTTPQGGWMVCSAASYGRLVGSFSLLHSGSVALFDLRISGLTLSTPVSTYGPVGVSFWRLVVAGNGVSSLIVPSAASGWVFVFNTAAVPWNLPGFVDMTSLGAGNYSAELQASVGLLVAASRFALPAGNGWVTLTVKDVLANA